MGFFNIMVDYSKILYEMSRKTIQELKLELNKHTTKSKEQNLEENIHQFTQKKKKKKKKKKSSLLLFFLSSSNVSTINME